MNMSQAEIDAMMSGNPAPEAPSGELSQAEIDAMMSGEAKPAEPDASSGGMSQAEIDAIMSGSEVNSAGSGDSSGGMSQAEIDAMMSGGGDAPADSGGSSGGMSQAEIDAMMSGGGEEKPSSTPDVSEMLTPLEIDTLGEVGNICMGSVATTMYTLLDRRVEITTPKVKLLTTSEILSMYQVPFVVVEVEYVEGILGKNLLLLREYDAALITDVLMGGEGSVEEPVELSELHMSAINEIMNQMIGSSATALSQIINTAVNISTPVSRRMTLEEGSNDVLATDEVVIVIDFDMSIENLLDSQLIQMMPLEQGREMAAMLTRTNEEQAAEAAAAPPPPPAPAPAAAPSVPAVAAPPSAAAATPMQFESFSPIPQAPPADAMNMVYDIPIQVSVELGKTKKEISEILEFDRGTVVVLEKNAGDPVEILVNGKLVASGEVVVIDENYGVRITHLHN